MSASTLPRRREPSRLHRWLRRLLLAEHSPFISL